MNINNRQTDFFSDEISELTQAINKLRVASISNQNTQIQSAKQYIIGQQAQGKSSEALIKQLERLEEMEGKLVAKTADLSSKMEKQDEKRARKATNFLTSKFGQLYNTFADGLGKFSRSAFGSTIGLNQGSPTMTDVGNSIQKYLGNMVNEISSMVDVVADTLADASIDINTRLQGSEKNFQDTYELMKDALGISPYLKQSEVIKSLQKLSNVGIERDLETRSFLDALSSEIANTFDATNDALLRIVRLQQEDSTASRLGMEVALTKLLNKQFKDTSYLNNTMDSVTSTLLELESQLSQDEALGVEYNVQKWLGALASLGMSDTALNLLAQGITYLGTGDVTSLSGNEGLQRLVTLAVAEQGEDLADILLNGLDTKMTNTIMEGMIKVLQRFGTTEYSQVVRSQFADLLGVDLSDFTSTLSLSAEKMSMLSASALNTQSALGNLALSINSVGDRMHLSAKLETAMDNFKWDIGSDIANSTTQYAIWKVNDIIEQVTGGINVPTISVLGNGVDMNANVNQLLKLGMIGINTLGSIDDFYNGMLKKNNLFSTLQKMSQISGTGGSSSQILASGSLSDMIASAFATDDTKNQIAKGSERTLNENIEEHTANIDAKLTQVSDTLAEWNKTKTVNAPIYDENNSAYQTAIGTSQQTANTSKLGDKINIATNGSQYLSDAKFISDHKQNDDATNQDIVNAINSLGNTMTQNGFNSGGY